jgi:hypothetical protein
MRRLSPLLAVLLAVTAYWLFKIWLDRPPTTTPDAADLFGNYLPDFRYWRSSLFRGEFPLWDPYEFCGVPSFAMMEHGPLYPLSAIYLFGKVNNAHLVSWLVHVSLGCVFYWIYLTKSLRVRPVAAAFGAVVFAFSGWAMARGMHFPDEFRSTVYLPLVFFFVDQVIERRTAGWCAGLSFALALQFLAGETELAIRTGQFLVPYVLMRLYQRRQAGDAMRTLSHGVAWLTGAAVLSALLVSVQMLPTLEMSSQGIRTVGGMSYGRAVQGAVTRAPELLGYIAGNSQEGNMFFVGLIPIVFAVYALRTRSAEAWYFFVAGLLSFGLMLGDGSPLYWIYFHIPGGNLFRFPDRFQVFFLFSCVMLSALGLNRLFDDAESPIDATKRLRDRTWHCVALLVVFLAGAIVWENITSAFEALIAVFTLGALCVAIVGWRVTNSRIWQGAAVVTLFGGACLVQILFFNFRPLNSPPDLDLLGAPKEVLAFLRERLEPTDRVYVDYSLRDRRRTPKFGPQAQMLCINGFTPFTPRRFWELVGEHQVAELRKPPLYRGEPLELIPLGLLGGLSLHDGAKDVLDMLSVRYIAIGPGNTLFGPPGAKVSLEWPGLKEVFRYAWYEEEEIRVFENENAWPRSFVMPDREITTPDALKHAIEAAHPARIVEYSPTRIQIEAPASAAGTLVLNDIFYPGWHAYVDGQEATIEAVAGVFRGVRVSGNNSIVEFHYAPISVRAGAILSSIGLVCAMLLVMISWRAERRKSAERRAQ